MRKVIIIVLIIAIALGGYFYIKNAKIKKEEAIVNKDKETIQMLNNACKKTSISSSLSALGSATTWHIFELEFIHAEGNNAVQQELEQQLGEDFKTSLSNGDSLFVGFLPYQNAYRIFAGSPESDECMIYPTWNYTGVEAFPLETTP